MRNDFAKDVAEKVSNMYRGTGDMCNQAQPVGLAGEYRPSPAEEASKRQHYHLEEAQKAARAAEFFQANPAFSEFITLIRSGVIGI